MMSLKSMGDSPYECGARSYREGNSCIPAFDLDFITRKVKGKPIGTNAGCLKEWINGWTDASLKPVGEEGSELIIERTGILCPDCFKGHLITDNGDDLYCDKCGTEFEFTDRETNTFRYK